MQFRHEIKHEISRFDMMILRGRLQHVMQPDPYAKDGRYHIRSLYFDNLYDKALREKTDGARIREKYRIRIYNHDPTFIRLERKYKEGSLGFKEQAPLTLEMTEAIIGGDTAGMARSQDRVILGFYSRIKNEGLVPRVLVDYTREPFVFSAGNVRVTLDYDIRTGLRCTDLLDPHCPTLPIYNNTCILELKWDSYLPDVIRDAIGLDHRCQGAFSKYAACRMYE